MNAVKDQIVKYINNEDKENAVKYILENLTKGNIDIVSLYEDILAPTLNDIAHYKKAQNIHIWQEHIRTSIVRTVIECCYPHVIKERDEKYKLHHGKKVLVMCPQEEYHEIGPRMVTDFFNLCGYQATFVGGNTPKEEILKIALAYEPDYIAISVSNYFHLVAAERAIKNLRSTYKKSIKIIVGGYAFNRNPQAYKDIGADLLLQDFDSIRQLEGSTLNETGI
ncbi:cobalamin-dependent protein [Serpentinicella sp. ANB-PHB4]|uniref:cobalamin B12-binding domain-containing protein n=1 Tax=Serpentinicella sp. ANB-PHB4 TaxID=3074076 RepID=UPI002862D0C4|nr:cobalamin-dependent protein [Serpentinicella sp. ANB-PHB4]MDR5658475.1 cobalamin-dependent protein [Serpentinicella sp. ANB-PHB4]